MKPLQEQIILITGATDGLGRQTAQELAARGAIVLLHGRNAQKLAQVRQEIEQITGNQKLETYQADFASLEEVNNLAREVQARHPEITMLINNAGIGEGNTRLLSKDGHELHFAVNYLATFLLTMRLLPALRAAAPARIVNVASIGQYPIDFTDVMLARDYSTMQAYQQSKLAMIMFSFDLAEQLQQEQITVNAMHPATFMPTKMVTRMGISPFSTIADGVDTLMFVATSPKLDKVTGTFFDQKRQTRAHKQAYDRTARQRLWKLSEELTGL